MKGLWMALALVSVGAGTAFGQGPYRLEFYADRALSSCELFLGTPGEVKVHMVITGQGSLAAISFKAPKPACMRSAEWIADSFQNVYGIAGSTQLPGGVDVIFNCAPLPQYIGAILYEVTEPADACCEYEPLPNSNYPGSMLILLWPQCPPEYEDETIPFPMRGRRSS